MAEPLFKIVNILHPLTGQVVLDVKTNKPVSRLIEMTEDEIAAFEAERSNRGQSET